MKLTSIITLIILAFHSSALAFDQAKLDEFKASVEAALEAKDIPALNRFFCTEGADAYQIDSTIYADFEADHESFTFDKLELTPLDGPDVSEAERKRLQGQTMNGHLYVPNLQPVFACRFTYKAPSGATLSNGQLIGFDPQGNPKFILKRPVAGTHTQP